MSQSSTSRSFVLPFAPWHVRARPLILAALALVLVGLALALPRIAPAAQAEGVLLYAIVDQQLISYDLATGQQVATVYDASGLPEGFLSAVTTGSDGDVYLAVYYREENASYQSQILRFDGGTGASLGTLTAEPLAYVVTELLASPDGQLYVNGNQRYRLSDRAYLGPFILPYDSEPYPPPGFPPNITLWQREFGPDGQLYYLGDFQSPNIGTLYSIFRFDPINGTYLGTAIPPQERYLSVFALGPDGTIYANDPSTVRFPGDRSRVLRFRPGGEPLGTLAELDMRINFMRVGPDGYLYARVLRGVPPYPFGSNALLRLDPQTGAVLSEYALGTGEIYAELGRRSFTFADSAFEQEDERPVRRANVGLAQRATPALQAARGELVTLTLTATNRGDGSATDATIDLPLDPARVQLLDAHFSRPEAWVSARREGGVTIQTGRLGSNGDTVTATLRLLVRADAPDGPLFPSRLTLRWRDAATGGTSAANLLPVAAAAQSLDSLTLPLAIDPPSAGPGVTRAVSASWLIPGESVGLWYNRPNGSAVAVGRVMATADGALSYQLATAGLAPGSYSLVAQGVSSGVILAGPFEVGE